METFFQKTIYYKYLQFISLFAVTHININYPALSIITLVIHMMYNFYYKPFWRKVLVSWKRPLFLDKSPYFMTPRTRKHMAAYMYVCMYVYMFVCMYGCMSVCMYDCMFVCLWSVCLSVCMRVCMYGLNQNFYWIVFNYIV